MLAEYFVTDQYRSDLNRKDRLSSQYEPEMTFKLKSVMKKYRAQYSGTAQHDSKEFLLWLLDKVHVNVVYLCQQPRQVIS